MARTLSSSRERSPRYDYIFWDTPIQVEDNGNGRLTVHVFLQKKEINSSRAADQKAVDKALLASIKKVDMLASYLASSFSLRKGDKPHEMTW